MESEKSKCSICLKSFRHIKHLKRHQLSHGTDRGEYECSTCLKTFTRKDGLQRHQRIHRNTTPSLVTSKGRACGRCVAAKTKCTGTLPCARCHIKHLDCNFIAALRTPTNGIESEGHRSNCSPHTTTARGSSSSPEHLSGIPQVVHEGRLERHDPSLPPAESQRDQSPCHVPLCRAQSRALQPIAMVGDAVLETTTFEYSQPHKAANIPRLTNWLQCQTNGADQAHMNDSLPSPFPTSLRSPFAQMQPYDNQSMQMLNIRSTLDREPARSMQTAHSEVDTPTHNDSTAGFGNSLNTTGLSTTGSNTSHAAHDGGDGILYVDGERARQPRQRKRLMLPPERSPVTSNFSLRIDSRNFQSQTSLTQHVTDDQYESMGRYFETLCADSSMMFEKYAESDFPPKHLFCTLIDNYFNHFSDLLPLIHQPTFEGSSKHFALLLAMATIGSYFCGQVVDNKFYVSLREFLRRVIWAVTDPPAGVKSPSLHETAHIHLLYAISVRHSTRSFEGALQSAISYCNLTWPRPHDTSETRDLTLEAQWTTWVEREEEIRTKFCIWLLDAIFASHGERTATLKLTVAVDHQLPCTESLWTAETPQVWAASKASSGSFAPTLQSTLQSLYIEKRLPTNLGEFARIIAIHGIYHRTWEVREYWQQGLSHFEPSAGRQVNDSTDIPSPAPIWHPSMDVPNRWRNAALDCLDILHWNANALIGLAHGVEHPTVLHLHFARIVLLSPMTNIIRLARYISATGVALDLQISPSTEAAKNDLRVVRQWVFQDQYKARLAAIHAGATFWYIRRFSNDAFYEPDTVALATLMLWAISKFLPTRQHGTDQSLTRGSIDNPLLGDDPQIVLLDRPIDDELVQQFVREGYTMHANMMGVGNLFGPHGPQRVLVEGQKLLATLGAWQDSRHHWTKVLNRLEQTNRSDVV